jgi:hypothetical protein
MGKTYVRHERDEKIKQKFRSENLKEGNNLEDLGIDGSILLRGILIKYGGRARTVFISFRVGTGDGLLLTR